MGFQYSSFEGLAGWVLPYQAYNTQDFEKNFFFSRIHQALIISSDFSEQRNLRLLFNQHDFQVTQIFQTEDLAQILEVSSHYQLAVISDKFTQVSPRLLSNLLKSTYQETWLVHIAYQDIYWPLEKNFDAVLSHHKALNHLSILLKSAFKV